MLYATRQNIADVRQTHEIFYLHIHCRFSATVCACGVDCTFTEYVQIILHAHALHTLRDHTCVHASIQSGDDAQDAVKMHKMQ